jgi:hypothetical protein
MTVQLLRTALRFQPGKNTMDHIHKRRSLAWPDLLSLAMFFFGALLLAYAALSV